MKMTRELLRLADAGPEDQQRDEGARRQVAREAHERLEERLDRLVRAHRHAERQREQRGDDEAAEDAPHRHADVLARSPSRVSSVQPSAASCIGSARKVFDTKPPKVASDQTATKRTKKARRARAARPAPPASSGFIEPQRPVHASLDELRVGELGHVGHRLDDAGFQQQVGRFLAELRVLAGEELLVRGAVLPAQVLLAASRTPRRSA